MLKDSDDKRTDEFTGILLPNSLRRVECSESAGRALKVVCQCLSGGDRPLGFVYSFDLEKEEEEDGMRRHVLIGL